MFTPLEHALIGSVDILVSFVLAFEAGLLSKNLIGVRLLWALRVASVLANGIGFIQFMAAALNVGNTTAVIILGAELICFIGLEQVIELLARCWLSRRSER